MAERPFIKKIKKVQGHGHHGGAWKVAYADFVTAMMAFFLLMWLLGSTEQVTKQGIAEYFQDPWKASLNGGDSVGDRTSVIQGGGTDLSSQDPGQVDLQQVPADAAEAALERAEQHEKEQLEMLKEKIQLMLDANPELNEFKDQIKLESTPEGLKIQIVDAKNRPMFKLASSETEPHGRLILRELAPVINELPNRITINGHTDALPFPDNRTGYSNWELSSDRANMARRELSLGGFNEEKVLRVIGLSSSIPYNSEDPTDPMNRRISIIVMNKKAENAILQEGRTDLKENEQEASKALSNLSENTKRNTKIVPAD
jgi:chemotaxis protein MotB